MQAVAWLISSGSQLVFQLKSKMLARLNSRLRADQSPFNLPRSGTPALNPFIFDLISQTNRRTDM